MPQRPTVLRKGKGWAGQWPASSAAVAQHSRSAGRPHGAPQSAPSAATLSEGDWGGLNVPPSSHTDAHTPRTPVWPDREVGPLPPQPVKKRQLRSRAGPQSSRMGVLVKGDIGTQTHAEGGRDGRCRDRGDASTRLGPRRCPPGPTAGRGWGVPWPQGGGGRGDPASWIWGFWPPGPADGTCVLCKPPPGPQAAAWGPSTPRPPSTLTGPPLSRRGQGRPSHCASLGSLRPLPFPLSRHPQWWPGPQWCPLSILGAVSWIGHPPLSRMSQPQPNRSVSPVLSPASTPLPTNQAKHLACPRRAPTALSRIPHSHQLQALSPCRLSLRPCSGLPLLLPAPASGPLHRRPYAWSPLPRSPPGSPRPPFPRTLATPTPDPPRNFGTSSPPSSSPSPILPHVCVTLVPLCPPLTPGPWWGVRVPH